MIINVIYYWWIIYFNYIMIWILNWFVNVCKIFFHKIKPFMMVFLIVLFLCDNMIIILNHIEFYQSFSKIGLIGQDFTTVSSHEIDITQNVKNGNETINDKLMNSKILKNVTKNYCKIDQNNWNKNKIISYFIWILIDFFVFSLFSKRFLFQSYNARPGVYTYDEKKNEQKNQTQIKKIER